MAFFGGHDTEDINVTLENSAIYESEVGLGIIALECTQFEAEIFGDCVRSDMKEYALVQEGADVEAFQEGAWETVKTKVKNFVEKVWAKIKAFFNGWYAKIAARIMSDNKAFYSKFKKDVANKKQLAELKLKWEAPTNAPTKFEAEDFNTLIGNKSLEEAESAEIIKAAYKGLSETVTTHAEAKKIMLKDAFDEEKEVSYTDIDSDVETTLANGNKDLSVAQNSYKKADSGLTKTIKDLENKVDKNTKNLSTIASIQARAHLTVLEAQVAIVKKKASQARHAFAKAVAYNPKTEGAFDADLLAVEADALMHE